MIYRRWRDADVLSTIFAMVGLIIAVLLYEFSRNLWELGMDGDMIDTEKYEDPMTHPLVNHKWTNPARIVIAGTSALAACFIVVRQYYKNMWLNEFFTVQQSVCNSQGVPDISVMFHIEIAGKDVRAQ